MRWVDQNWIGVERVFTRITPFAGLFENKDTNEIFFETKQNSWSQNDIIERMPWDHKGFRNLIEKRLWNRLFYYISRYSHWCAAADFLKALAEIVHVNEPQEDQLTSLHLATNYGNIDLLQILLKRPGADPNMKSCGGKSPLYQAMYWHMIATVTVRNPFSKFIENVKKCFNQTSSTKIQKSLIQIKQIEFLEILFFHGTTVDETESTLINQLEFLGFRIN